jgi:hypothetical protein
VNDTEEDIVFSNFGCKMEEKQLATTSTNSYKTANTFKSM